MRLVGERKACAAIVLAMFSLLFLTNGLLGPPAFAVLFYALGAAYLTAFFGLVAGWFWARWYTMGLAFSGLLMAVMLWWQIGLDPVVMFWGGTHLVVGLALVGKGPALAFDGRKDWRERWRMDDNSVNRLGKAVMRAGASVPYQIMAGLAPKQGMGAGALLALAAGTAGLWALVRLRTWGVFALAGAGALALLCGPAASYAALDVRTTVPMAGAIAGVLLAAAVAPFARPLARALRRG